MRNDFTDQNNYLMHSSRGKERKNHKYLKRDWVNGRWEYTYKGDSNTKSKSSSQSEFEEKAAKQRAESDAWYQNKLAESAEKNREYEEKNGTYEERVAKQRAEYDALYQKRVAEIDKKAEEWDRETKEELNSFADEAEKSFKNMLNAAKKNNDELISKLEKNKITAKFAGMMRTFSNSTFGTMESMMTSHFDLMRKMMNTFH